MCQAIGGAVRPPGPPGRTSAIGAPGRPRAASEEPESGVVMPSTAFDTHLDVSFGSLGLGGGNEDDANGAHGGLGGASAIPSNKQPHQLQQQPQQSHLAASLPLPGHSAIGHVHGLPSKPTFSGYEGGYPGEPVRGQ